MKRKARRTLSAGLVTAIIAGALMTPAVEAGSPAISLRGGAWLTGVEEAVHAQERPGSTGAGAQRKFAFDMKTEGRELSAFVSGEASVGSIAFHGFYGTGEVSGLEARNRLAPIDREGRGMSAGWTSSYATPMEVETYYVLAGYDFGPASVGGGWLSLTEAQTQAGLTQQWEDRTSAAGPAIGGFGSVPLGGNLVLAGNLVYAPAVATASTFSGTDVDGVRREYERQDGTGQALAGAARLGYRVTDSLSVDVGYRRVGMRTELGEERVTDLHTGEERAKTSHSRLSVSGYFAAVTFRFR